MSNTKRGIIKFWKKENGYGFIETESGEDLFAHRSGISDKNYVPSKDDTVDYEEVQGKKGLQGINIVRV